MVGFVRRCVREPLAHFLVIGAALFGAHAVVARRVDTAHRIDLKTEDVKRRIARITGGSGRVPTDLEREAMVREMVDDEILCREARRRGLDQRDEVIRRRLVQQMEFFTQDATPVPEPTDPQLEAFLASHVDAFREPDRIGFDQIFLSGDQRGDRLASDAQRLLGEARATAPTVPRGDPFIGGDRVESRSLPEIERTFGAAFASGLAGLPKGTWEGPIASPLGLHLVRITERVTSRVPSVGEVRSRLRAAYLEDAHHRNNRAALEALRRQYDVRVDPVIRRPAEGALALGGGR
jgi:hypothetical protein